MILTRGIRYVYLRNLRFVERGPEMLARREGQADKVEHVEPQQAGQQQYQSECLLLLLLLE